MALFGKKKNTEEKAPKSETKAVTVAKGNVGMTHAHKGLASGVIIRPRVTEKTHTLAESGNVYVFNVEARASKGKVTEAIRDLYKVTPVKVSIMPVPKKTRFVRGKVGTSKGGRKAYVYLKKGEKLEIA
ncbi:MAG TPA: 50S ribosomal protein L23 [Candidatus Paceibacterota bacterium]